jgi:hypothetical protein
MAFLAPSWVLFFVFACVAEVLLFTSTSPINAAILRSAPPALRASAMAAAIFAIHMFGDLWSPPAVGWLADHLPIVTAMMILPALFGLGAFLWWPKRIQATAT